MCAIGVWSVEFATCFTKIYGDLVMNLKSIKIFVLVLFFMLPSASFAAAYIKFDGVDGESVDKDHDKWIDVLSWSFGASSNGRKCSISDFSIIKNVDAASTDLIMAVVEGTMFETAVIDVTRVGGDVPTTVPYLKIEFSDVKITGFSDGGSDGALTLTESIAFSFGSATYIYTKQDSKGGSSMEIMTTINGC